MKKYETRMSEELWQLIHEVSQLFDYDDLRGSRSYFIRDVLSDAVAEWKYSPYICHGAENFIYISAQGHAFHRVVERLRFNSRRLRLPCLETQKLEKQRAYSAECKETGQARETWLQSKWLLNYFAAQELDGGPLLDEHVDRFGVTEKTADLEVDKDNPDEIQREVIVGLSEYAQWAGDDTKVDVDRIAIPVDCPTRNFRLCLLIDEALYDGAAPPIRLAFRNHEGAKFENRDLIRILENQPLSQSGRFPEHKMAMESLDRLAREQFQQLVSRLEVLASTHVKVKKEPAKTGSGFEIVPVVLPHNVPKVTGLRFPERYLFFRVDWSTPHMGIHVCAEFKKPPRPDQPNKV